MTLFLLPLGSYSLRSGPLSGLPYVLPVYFPHPSLMAVRTQDQHILFLDTGVLV